MTMRELLLLAVLLLHTLRPSPDLLQRLQEDFGLRLHLCSLP